MSSKSEELIEQRQALLEQLPSFTDVLWVNLLERYTTCIRPTCKCHRGELHGPRYYLTSTENGKQKQRYIPVRHVEQVKRGAEQRRQIEEILRQITAINLALMEEECDE